MRTNTSKNKWSKLIVLTLLGNCFLLFVIGCSSVRNLVAWFPFGSSGSGHYGITEKDIAKFASGLRPHPGNAETHYQLGCHFQKKRKHQWAIDEFARAIRVNPNYVEAYNGMGISYDSLGDYPRAIACYQEALKLNPDLDYVQNNLGYSYLLQGNLDSAIATFRKATDLNNANRLYHNNLGLAYAKKGDAGLALAEFKQSGDEATARHNVAQLLGRDALPEETKVLVASVSKVNKPDSATAELQKDEPLVVSEIHDIEEENLKPVPETPLIQADRKTPGETGTINPGNSLIATKNSPEILCSKSVHSSTEPVLSLTKGSPRTDHDTVKINYLAERPEPFLRQAQDVREKPIALSPSTPFILSLSKERTVLRTGLSKGERFAQDRLVEERTANYDTAPEGEGDITATTPTEESRGGNNPGTCYTVQVGAFRDPEGAEKTREKFAEKGHQVHIATGAKDETLHQVRIGRFGTREQAEVEASKIKQEEGIAAFPVPEKATPSILLASNHPGQKAEGREQVAEGREQVAEGREQIVEGRRQEAEGDYSTADKSASQERITPGNEESHKEKQDPGREIKIEISNGNGVYRMARTVGSYLRGKGFSVTQPTNACHFNHAETKVYYCDGYLQDAYHVAQQIPRYQNMERVSGFEQKDIKIKVVIGKDLIAHESRFNQRS